MLLFLVLYTVRCAQVIRMSNRAGLRLGTIAAILVIAANVIGVFAGAFIWALVRLP
jgi:hypothetical protein